MAQQQDNYWQVRFDDAEKDLNDVLSEKERVLLMTDEEVYRTYGLQCRADAVHYYDDMAGHAMERLFEAQAHIDGVVKFCPKCNGKGITRGNSRLDAFGHLGFGTVLTCPTCKGTGRSGR